METRDPAPVEPIKRKPSPVERKQVVATSPKGGGEPRSKRFAGGRNGRPPIPLERKQAIEAQILALLIRHPLGIAPREIASLIHMDPQDNLFKTITRQMSLDKKIAATGKTNDRRWFPNGPQ